ncbi:M56 family metallopeptidase [Aliiroseovarius crassostreae]|uniref:M56 family metallopeptidase n=1 Tax=Aliiroseovarius crassostreae TaxID=154981 RepID=UPI0021F9AAFA|nr:M56 family metallopeptidase [Aliiroseovarius crassostreae]UWQ06517.1 M56 family metallopeptidase [Aliiroseovarius crassostreae]
MTPDAWLNTYLDLNLLIIAGTAIWFGLRWGIARTSLNVAFRPQLRLLNALTVFLALTPLLALAMTTWIVHRPPNLSDLLVAQYLQGNVNMSASTFETLLGLREDFVREVLTGQALWAQVLTALIVTGTLLVTVQVILSVLRLRHSLRRAHPYKRIGRVRLLLSDHSRVAYSTRGLFTRYVVLPTALLQDSRDLRLTVAHELQHFRQRDVECEFLLEILRPLTFWNPCFFLWRRQVRLLREYACDQALIARHRLEARAYCECLIRACAKAAREPALFARTTPSVALVDRRETRNRSSLRNRILAVAATEQGLGQTHGPIWMVLTGCLISAVVMTMLLMQRPGDWSHDRIMLSTIVNLERMANRQSTFATPLAALPADHAPQ